MKGETRDRVRDEIRKARSDVSRQWIVIRELCRKYNVEELEAALEIVSVPLDEFAVEIVTYALQRERHREMVRPHWTIPWTFWMVLVGILIALWAWLFPRSPADASKVPNPPQSEVVAPPTAPTSPIAPSNSPPPASTQSALIQAKPPLGPLSRGTNSVAEPASPKK